MVFFKKILICRYLIFELGLVNTMYLKFHEELARWKFFINYLYDGLRPTIATKVSVLVQSRMVKMRLLFSFIVIQKAHPITNWGMIRVLPVTLYLFDDFLDNLKLPCQPYWSRVPANLVPCTNAIVFYFPKARSVHRNSSSIGNCQMRVTSAIRRSGIANHEMMA